MDDAHTELGSLFITAASQKKNNEIQSVIGSVGYPFPATCTSVGFIGSCGALLSVYPELYPVHDSASVSVP